MLTTCRQLGLVRRDNTRTWREEHDPEEPLDYVYGHEARSCRLVLDALVKNAESDAALYKET